MSEADLIERVWYGSDRAAAFARAMLTPAERLFGAIVGARALLYDAGWLPAAATSIPAISVGNLTVGGTGKTPISAWVARGLAARGAHPALVLRGYGNDEPLVHARLNANIPVITGADRVAAVEAAARGGADVAVLDDAFQHRRIHRVADLVLVSADRWTSDARLLPAGPWREPLDAVRRATLVIVTRKAASDLVVNEVHERLSRIAPAIPRVSVRLDPDRLVRVDEPFESEPLSILRGASVFAVVSIADPRAFASQLEALGARVRLRAFADHHAFTAHDVAQIVTSAAPGERIVCTLKDAVKLGPHWPRLAPSVWYVSQHVMVERGVGGLERVLDDLVRARSSTTFKPPAHAGP